jgi:Mor family transcriptional regulator
MTVPRNECITLPDDALPTIAELPGDLRRVAEIIRPAVASDLVAVRLVFAMADEFAGTDIYCSGTGKWKRKYRDQRIRNEYDAGTKAPQLARRYNLSERWVWDILGRLPPDEKQLGLW